MDLCDIADAVFYIGGGDVPDVIIDQRKIGLEQRRDDDAAIVCELIFVIINIDDVCIIANVIVILARPFDDAAAGLIAAVCVDRTRPECLFQRHACHFIDHLTDRDVPFRLADCQIVLLGIEGDAHDTVLTQTDQIRMILVQLADHIRHSLSRAARLRELAPLQDAEFL